MTTCKPTESSAPPGTHGEFALTLEHLTTLAKDPGWKHYAWGRAKELDADRSGLFKGMAEALKAAMTGPANTGAPDAQTLTKPHSANPK